MNGQEKILVIKLSALGDMVLAMPAFASIRAAHLEAQISLLTTAPYVEWMQASPWFDHVEGDGRPATLGAWLRLVHRMRRARFDRIYDLQANNRTNWLFQALRPGAPEWSGTALGCSLPRRDPVSSALHPIERNADQLRSAGVVLEAPPDLSWLVPAPTPRAHEAAPLALIVPGVSANHPEKRWPTQHFGQLAAGLIESGLEVAIVGGAAEAPLGKLIHDMAPTALDLTGRTSLQELAALAAGATVAIGADTGPMHLIAAVGAPCVVLFGPASSPALNAPRGAVTCLQSVILADLSVSTILSAALQSAAAGRPDFRGRATRP